MRKQEPKICEHCGKEFKSGAGVAMHMKWVNGKEHPMKGKKLTGEALERQRKNMKKARVKSPSHISKGKRIKMICLRQECSNEFEATESASKRRKYCSKSCLALDTPTIPMSPEKRKELSERMKEKYAKNPQSNPFYGRTPSNYNGWGKGQFVEELGFWVRSTWEKEYMLALKNANIEFEYESIRFDLGDSTYCPDILLTGTDVFVEITGWDKPIKQEKRKKFSKQYPEKVLLVWDKAPTLANQDDFVKMCKKFL